MSELIMIRLQYPVSLPIDDDATLIFSNEWPRPSLSFVNFSLVFVHNFLEKYENPPKVAYLESTACQLPKFW